MPRPAKQPVPKAKPKKKPGKPRTHRTSAISKDRKPDVPKHVGHEERLTAYQKMALDLKRKGHYHHQIADIVAIHFNLEYTPPITTVASWLKAGNDAVNRDIEELQWQMRLEQFKELETLKAKWMPLAIAEELHVKRMEMQEGQLVPVIDEDATKEQLKATETLVKIMTRQASLLGLDIAKAVQHEGEGPQKLQDLQVWLIGQVNMVTGAPNGGAIDVHSEILELRSGVPEIDQDENSI
jgi:hypothetical protein